MPSFGLKFFVLLFLSFFLHAPFETQVYGAKDKTCAELTAQLALDSTGSGRSKSGVTDEELSSHVLKALKRVPEFEYSQEEAAKMGLRVWLFGGTASSFLHYAKWDLAREKGILDLQKDRFDYDFTNIFRSTQDLDIVVDAKPEVAREFQNRVAQRFPHFLGNKANKWEVRTLRHRMGTAGQPGFKEALLNDADFNNQNTDSNSVGMVELTRSKEPVIRDLRHWEDGKGGFLNDTLSNQISFFRSDKHFTTSRAKAGQNPEILSVIRLLVKAFQYELEFSPQDFRKMKEVVDEFDPRQVNNSDAIRRINDTAKKLVMHAVNIEYAMNKLDELGLRKKLIALGNKAEHDNPGWWLNKEPLRSKTVGEGRGQTASELGVKVVAHETNNFLAYESITRAHSGEPNVLISRQNAVGEAAAYGDGFYTRLGKEGARGTGLTIRFTVDPNAREGTDFTKHGDYIVFKNKKALKVIQESLNFGLDDLLKLAEENKDVAVDHSDLALLEKLKRRLNASRINDELEKLLNSKSESDQKRLIHILSAFQNSTIERLIAKETLGSVAKNVFNKVSHLATSEKEEDTMRYLKTVGPILKTLDSAGALKTKDFVTYLNKIIKSEKSFSLRKEAVFEKLLSSDNFEEHLNFKKDLRDNEIGEVVSDIKDWHKSQDNRQRKFAVELDKRWGKSIESGDTKTLQALADSRLFDINRKNVSGLSALLTASYYNQKSVIDWLLKHPDFDLNARNTDGYNLVEQLRLFGKTELADEIEKKRLDAKGRKRVAPDVPLVKIEPVIEPRPELPLKPEHDDTIQIQGGKSVSLKLPNGQLQDLGFRAPPDGITYKEGYQDGAGNVLVLLGGTGKGFNVKLKDGPVIISRLQQWENGVNPEVTKAIPDRKGSGFMALDKDGVLYQIDLPTRQKREFSAKKIRDGSFTELFQANGKNYVKSHDGAISELKENRTGQWELVEIKQKEKEEKIVKNEKKEIPHEEKETEPAPKESRFVEVRERNRDGSPIVDMVRFEPGSFLMGDEDKKVLTTITKPFEAMSTLTTKKVWKEVTELSKKISPQKYGELDPHPSAFGGAKSLSAAKIAEMPVESVSYQDIELWNQGLNELSKSGDARIQEQLQNLFPGHKKGDAYRLPTEAEHEYMARLGGFAEGDYAYGTDKTKLDDYAWYSNNSGNQPHPVGEKKPVFFNGKPLYDLSGNVWVWVQDWYGNNISGGTDPLGPSSGSNRVIRGGSWHDSAQCLRSAFRNYCGPADRYSDFGFRLVRTP